MNLIISGTNRLGSNSLKVARYYQEQLQRRGEEWEIFSLSNLPHDIIFSDLYGKRSKDFAHIQEKISVARKFIFIIPEYNGSYPGVLKVFIDACTFPASFYHKKAILVGVATGKYGNIRGVDHFTGVCNYMRMHVLPLKIHIPHIQNELNNNNEFTDNITIEFIDEQIEEIIRF
ncbi:NADPH-dependent FMN reductase [Sphingobacterium lumbrici]|uniref:NADPH-dependent FMN reductase n=1 Tax=Sphingobacterium lumbrici TaxID=2559600 RepID=UPI001128D7F3|nr:NAD(P)H-dependent oxidoreductase [Sphingobacterium lumbrici]